LLTNHKKKNKRKQETNHRVISSRLTAFEKKTRKNQENVMKRMKIILNAMYSIKKTTVNCFNWTLYFHHIFLLEQQQQPTTDIRIERP